MANIPQRSQDLESLCYLETVFQEHGFDDGYRDGKDSGELEGRIFGCEKAFDLAREIGFYSGCIDAWSELATIYPNKINERALRHIQTLKKMISEFPSINDKEADMYNLRDKIKNKYRVITSLLNVQQKFIMVDKPKIVY